MLLASTPIEHWTALLDQDKTKLLPAGQLYVRPLMRGLYLTIDNENDRLITRSGDYDHHPLCKTFTDHLSSLYGGTPALITLVVRHKLLPETQGRDILIEVISDNKTVDPTAFDFDVYLVQGTDIASWPVMRSKKIFDIKELGEELLWTNRNHPNSTGVLVEDRVISNLTDLVPSFWYRRNFSYAIVATVTAISSQAMITFAWTDPVTKEEYYGHIHTKGRGVVSELVKNYGHSLVGKHLDLRYQTAVLDAPGRWRLFGVRYESVVAEVPERSKQRLFVI